MKREPGAQALRVRRRKADRAAQRGYWPDIHGVDLMPRDALNYGNLTKTALIEKAQALEPARLALFHHLLRSRRRAAGQSDTTEKEMLNDAFAYASEVRDPVRELAEFKRTVRTPHPGASSGLMLPALIYVGAERE